MSKNVPAGSSTGMIALRNATQKSIAFSSALSETRPRVLSLHRDCLRSVPWTKRAFNVPLSDQKMRSLVSDVFREKRNTTDVHQINRLIALGRMELEETLMLWKGESHIQGFFDGLLEKEAARGAKPPTFLDNFLAGK
mmetsp:Transcript_44008/g.73084  ORF Transcript_44008/g.73084 Transcript_44008/m.73084 type:complete len:138 (-) Transcript_44008:481-894(-)